MARLVCNVLYIVSQFPSPLTKVDLLLVLPFLPCSPASVFVLLSILLRCRCAVACPTFLHLPYVKRRQYLLSRLSMYCLWLSSVGIRTEETLQSRISKIVRYEDKHSSCAAAERSRKGKRREDRGVQDEGSTIRKSSFMLGNDIIFRPFHAACLGWFTKPRTNVLYHPRGSNPSSLPEHVP